MAKEMGESVGRGQILQRPLSDDEAAAKGIFLKSAPFLTRFHETPF
jgi:hypothetical protein